MPTTGARGLPGWLWRMLIALVLTQTAAFLVRPALTYRAIDLGADDVLVGVLVAVYAFLPALLAVPIGRYSDRHRPAPVFVAGIAMLGLGSSALVLAPELVTLTLATIVLGLGAMTIMVGSQSVVARISSGGSLDRDFGLTAAAASLGQMVGPLLAGFIIVGGADRSSSTLVVFALGGALCVVGLGFALRYPDQRSAELSGASPRWRETTGILRRPGVPGAMLASVSLLTTVDLLVAYLPLVGERAGISPATVGVLLSLRAGASVLSRVLISPLVRRFSRRRLIITSTAVTALLVPTIGFLGLPWLLGAILVVLGFFLGLGQPLTMTVITQAVPADSRGAALSIRMLGNKSGQVVLPALIASATVIVGLGGAFVVLGIILAGATVASVVSHPPPAAD